MELTHDFFDREDVVQVSRDLLGKVVVSTVDGTRTAGIITETEAYAGVDDKASHAYGGRRTPRTEVMYHKAGTVYIYLIYGMYHLLNFVTNKPDVPHAVLIRGIKPIEGIRDMEKRRGKPSTAKNFTSGPGTLSQALGLTKELTGTSIGDHVVVEDHKVIVPESQVNIGPRIGVDYAGEDALRPYRFLWKG